MNQISEGVTITPAHSKPLREIIDRHFSNKPVDYISNRFYSYAVDPLTYLNTSKIHNLLTIAIVAKTEITKSNALLEGSFYDKVFKKLSNTMAWVQEIILNHSD